MLNHKSNTDPNQASDDAVAVIMDGMPVGIGTEDPFRAIGKPRRNNPDNTI